MGYGNAPLSDDAVPVPIAEVFVPGDTLRALQGSTLTNTDGSGRVSSPANFNLKQINDLAVQMAGSDAVTATHVLEILQALYNGSTVDQQRSSAAGDGLSTGVAAAANYLYNGTSEDRQRSSAAGDGLSTGVAAGGLYLYNGASMDRQRGNIDNISVLSSGDRTTTQTQADQTNYNHKGIIAVLDMTVVGTGSVTLEIDGKDPVSGKYYALLTGAAVITNVTNIYRVYPGLTASANATANDVLPRTWRIKVTANNSNTCTYSVGCMLIV